MDHFQTRRFLSSWQLIMALVLAVALGSVTIEQGVATAAPAGGQYTIPTGNVDVVWPAGWTVYFQNEEAITLTNAAETMSLKIMAIQNTGRSWDDIATSVVTLLTNGQDANVTVSGPEVTDSGFWVTTENEDGPQMAVGFAATDPAVYLQIYATNIAPGADLTALATEAHGVTVDGTPALQGIEAVIPAATGTDAGIPPATPAGAGGTPAAAAAAGGQYTIPTGTVDVVWPAGWTVYFQNEEAITLTNAAETMALQIMAIQNTGRSWDDIATSAVSLLSSGQGTNGTVSGPVVTDSGFSFATDGDDGPQMAVGFAATDPAVYLQIFATNIAPGSDLTALATDAHGVTVDGTPALQGIEAVIPAA